MSLTVHHNIQNFTNLLFTCFISFAILKISLKINQSPANLNFDNVSKSNF